MKTIQIDPKLLKVLLVMLEDYGEVLSNNGCNDLPREIENLFTKEEGEQLAKEFAVMNNPKHPEGPNWPLPDWCLLALIKRKLTQ